MKCIKCCVLFFFINCSIFKISCMNFFNNVKNGDIDQMINKLGKFCGDAGFGGVGQKIIKYTTEVGKKLLNNFKLDGNCDAEKLLDLKNKIGNFIPILKKLPGVKDDEDTKNILEEIRKIFGNIKKEDLEADNSPAGIKKVLASSMLFSGDKKTKDVEVNIDKEADAINKEDKLIFLFHGMGDDSGKFYGAIQNEIAGFSVVSVEYNGSSLSNLDTFIGNLYRTYKGTIEKFHNIYILGYSFGCLIANKFRSKLLEEFRGNEFKGQDRKVHFVFYKGFYDISRCPLYTDVISRLIKFNQLYETMYENGGFGFLKDRASDNDLADVTSNYKLLSESRLDTMFSIDYVSTHHNVFGNEIKEALENIEKSIKDNPNKNHVLFVSSENDEMVSEGGRMLFDALARPQGSAVEKIGKQSPDCCY